MGICVVRIRFQIAPRIHSKAKVFLSSYLFQDVGRGGGAGGEDKSLTLKS